MELFLKQIFGMLRMVSSDKDISPAEKARILNAALALGTTMPTVSAELKAQTSTQESYNEIMIQVGDLVMQEMYK